MYLFIGVSNTQEATLTLSEPKKNQTFAEHQWRVERDLAQNLLAQIVSLLESQNLQLSDLSGLGVFAGPASFTNLRVTHTIANTLAYSLKIAVVSAGSSNWQQKCWQDLRAGQNRYLIKPDYGLPPTTTQRRK